MKKFEPQYRLVRVGMATKAERASRQQRTSMRECCSGNLGDNILTSLFTQASSARTDKRPCVVRRRSRARSPRRRNKLLAFPLYVIVLATDIFYQVDRVGRIMVMACGCDYLSHAELLFGRHPAIDTTSSVYTWNPSRRRDGWVFTILTF